MAPSRSSKDRESQEARVLANRYEVVKKLGSGNFGTAFLCRDRKNDNESKVLKEISVGDLQPDETVDAMHEARLLSKLNHPGIVKFADSFIDGEFFCIITEYCEGGDLDNKITEYKKAGKTFTESNVLNWTIQLLLAVQYMHSRRVLHRDLKTRNIFIRNNMMKIGDFGISRILMGTMDMASTFTGTPYYMSPEVLKHEGYNSKSDVWSIGCIMYELCSLEHAFMGQGLMAVMYKIVEKEPPDLPNKYSKDADAAFKKMLIKDPDKRPSASEVLKVPYVAKHMNKMKDLLNDEYKSKHLINQETANKEADELAILLREKSHLDDLRSTIDRKSAERDRLRRVEEEKEEMATQRAETKPKMTAREKLRLRKLEEADRKAKEMRKAAKIQLVENTERREKIKESMEKTSVPAWKGGMGEGKQLKQAITVRDPRLDETTRRASSGYEHHSYDGYNSSDEEEQQTIVRRNPPVRTISVPRHGSLTLDSGRSSRSMTDHRPSSLSMTVFPDDRPITPMKDLMVYGREQSSLDFEDGIPATADLANTYYEQFEDFDEGQGHVSTDDDDDVISPSHGHYHDNDEEGGESTLTGEDSVNEQENFISYLEKAMDAGDAESTLVSDDTVLGAYGPGARDTKVKNLRRECVKMLGQGDFEKAYKYLRDARYSKSRKDLSEKEIMDGLAKYVKYPADCFIVDQLLFLEEQAKNS